ncbi:MAG: endonuclease V [Methanomassiliicoccus sp.]|nr:endonuclease V [Methanomassiliicoccus sp.]
MRGAPGREGGHPRDRPVCPEDLDLAPFIVQAAERIPKGWVATFGDIAAALGDRLAARAVGEVLSGELPPGVPAHRVVYSDGRTGRSHGGADADVLLRSEGVEVEKDRVADLDARRFTDLRIEPVLKTLREEQERVRELIVERDDLDELGRIAGLDIAYSGHRAFAAVTVYDAVSGELVEERVAESVVRFPYIPTYLTFRELPALRPLIRSGDGTVYLVDGHGVLHPRGVGVASHLGVCLDVPTVGAAKSALTGRTGDEKEGKVPVSIDGQVRGYRLGRGRSVTFVSVGHRVSLGTAVEVCERFLDRGIPLPLRRAHDLAGQAKRASA